MSKLSISRYFVNEKLKVEEPKAVPYSDKKLKTVRLSLLVALLCALSFYFGGKFCSEKHRLFSHLSLASKPATEVALSSPQVKTSVFPECGIAFQDYTPCTDPTRWRKYNVQRLFHMERHCPPFFERKECLIPPPTGYKPPIKWPKSKDECWYRNVPYDWINNQKSNQHWLRKEGEKFIFPGGGTMFPNGVGEYVDRMETLIPGMKDGSIRTALDTGCGVASWGGDLLDRGILTMSLAPRDNHEAQVQFALERGIPAILGVLSTHRLPFPSNSFDMAHCSRCLIPWTEYGGIYLLEIHRILRPGGFWVLSGPPVNYEVRAHGWNTTVEYQRSNYNDLQSLLTNMCFKLYNEKDDIAVWQKTSDNSCYNKLAKPDVYPPQCDDSFEQDDAWYVPIRPCVVVPDQKWKRIGLQSLPKWPQRLHVAPERVGSTYGGNSGAFKLDDSNWTLRVKHYKTVLPALGSDKIRNVMDMNTMYGGFAAALVGSPIWVMNVVSSYGTKNLGVVYDRGLIGVYHDWCEPFSTYPRTYDLLHLDGLFTAESHRCDIKYVLLEMDRILRPNGYVLIREASHIVEAISPITKALRWGCQKRETESSKGKEKLLVCQKKLWYSSKM
ncbi:probable methyltransferase PMT21 [Nymphaea colorata]|nr:probable methyltransferase PMT21 [Nymphaea colorata]